jgi:hypothetical protein
MSRNKCFFLVRIPHVLRFISICDLFTDCLVIMFHFCKPIYLSILWLVKAIVILKLQHLVFKRTLYRKAAFPQHKWSFSLFPRSVIVTVIEGDSLEITHLRFKQCKTESTYDIWMKLYPKTEDIIRGCGEKSPCFNMAFLAFMAISGNKVLSSIVQQTVVC